ncbi:unnamed protein product [Gadus morhua 'NCC']
MIPRPTPPTPHLPRAPGGADDTPGRWDGAHRSWAAAIPGRSAPSTPYLPPILEPPRVDLCLHPLATGRGRWATRREEAHSYTSSMIQASHRVPPNQAPSPLPTPAPAGPRARLRSPGASLMMGGLTRNQAKALVGGTLRVSVGPGANLYMKTPIGGLGANLYMKTPIGGPGANLYMKTPIGGPGANLYMKTPIGGPGANLYMKTPIGGPGANLYMKTPIGGLGANLYMKTPIGGPGANLYMKTPIGGPGVQPETPNPGRRPPHSATVAPLPTFSGGPRVDAAP